MTQPLGYFLSYKDTPVISNFANDPVLNNKNSYDTLVRMSFTAKHIGHAVYEVSYHFGTTKNLCLNRLWRFQNGPNKMKHTLAIKY